jgi:Uma2 family endonuclease
MSTVILPTSTTTPLPTSGGPLMTAEEFFQKHANDRVELVRGIVREMPMAELIHGFVEFELVRFLGNFVADHKLGRVIGLDSFIKVRSNPDSVRGPDLMFVSYARLPRGKIPHGLIDVIPELVIEVRSPSNTWTEIFSKVDDYLSLGVTAVGVVNTDREVIGIYRDNMNEVHFTKEQDLVIPDVLPGFVLPLSKVFEQ